MIKIGIIGVGHMGSFHAKTVINSGICKFEGVYDIDIEQSKKLLEKYPDQNIKIYLSANDLISQCDGIIIATPASTHNQVIYNVIQHEKHILCEKPVSISWKDLSGLSVKYMEKQAVLHIGHCERFGDLIKNFNIDDAYRLSLFGKRTRITFTRLTKGNRNSDVNIVWDTMIHDIDLLYYLFPHLKEVDTTTIKVKTTLNKEKTRVEHLEAKLLFPNAIEVVFIAGKSQPENQRSFTIENLTDKTLRKYDITTNIIHQQGVSGQAIDEPITKSEYDVLSLQFRDFIYAIENNGTISNTACHLWDNSIFRTTRTADLISNIIGK